MSSEFIAKWHLDLVAWASLVAVAAAALAALADRWLTGLAGRIAATSVLFLAWLGAAAARHLVDPAWLLAVGVAAGGAAIGVGQPNDPRGDHNTDRPDRSPKIQRATALTSTTSLLSTMAMLAAWGIWAAVPDTDVAVAVASSITVWWMISITLAVLAPHTARSIGFVPAAALALALPAALIGRAGGTSWIGALGCFAPVVGLWFRLGVQQPSVQRTSKALPPRPSVDPMLPSERTHASVRGVVPSERAASLVLLAHLAAVYWSSRILSQAGPTTALAGAVALFVAGLATPTALDRFTATDRQRDLEGSSDE